MTLNRLNGVPPVYSYNLIGFINLTRSEVT